MHLFQLNGFPSATIKQDVSFCLPSLAWLYGMHSLLIGPLLLGGTTVLVRLYITVATVRTQYSDTLTF